MSDRPTAEYLRKIAGGGDVIEFVDTVLIQAEAAANLGEYRVTATLEHALANTDLLKTMYELQKLGYTISAIQLGAASTTFAISWAKEG